MPRLGIAALALVLAALFVFFFGPMLLGFGKNDQPGAGAGATPSPTVAASHTPEPTVAPSPSPTVYIVVRNDTFSKIARKLGVTIEVLKAANPQIKNIDKIKIGDQVNIPEKVPSGGASAQP
jgi:LysM repeat protein